MNILLDTQKTDQFGTHDVLIIGLVLTPLVALKVRLIFSANTREIWFKTITRLGRLGATWWMEFVSLEHKTANLHDAKL